MIFRFLLLSDEVDDFRREIQINSNFSFLDLHNAILESANFKDNEMCSFFICSDDWEKEKEITLIEMDTNSDEDAYIMKDCCLEDFIEDEGQKLMYVFDYMTERAFFMELREIITGKNLDKAICSKSIGEAPAQFVDFENFETNQQTSDFDENFYGDESYNMDELDAEGFEGLDNLSAMEDENYQ